MRQRDKEMGLSQNGAGRFWLCCPISLGGPKAKEPVWHLVGARFALGLLVGDEHVLGHGAIINKRDALFVDFTSSSPSWSFCSNLLVLL